MTYRSLPFFTLAFTSAIAGPQILQSFEGDGFGDWNASGSAFGLAPVAGIMDGLTSPLTGYSQESLVCSAHGGDAATGSLESPTFTLTSNFLGFLIAGGNHPGKTSVQLIIDGNVVMQASGKNSLNCQPVVWNITQWKGKSASIRIVDSESGKWGIIAADHFILSDNDSPTFPATLGRAKSPAETLVSSDSIPGLTLPPGTRATVIADFKTHGVTSPTALTFGDQGEIYLAETLRFRHGVPDNRDHLYWYLDDISSRTTEDRRKLHEKWKDKDRKTSLAFLTEKSDRVRRLSAPDPQTGVFTKSNIYTGNLNDLLDGPAAGLFHHEGSLFLACIPKIYAYQDKDGNGEADIQKTILDGFGIRVSFSGHDLNGFVLAHDGRIYGTLGDRGMNSTTPEGRNYELVDEGCVFRFDPDGSNFEVIHTGLRNPKEIAFDELGNAFSVDNNCDQGDKARIVYIVEGADSGWHMGHQGLLAHHRQMGMEQRPPASWMSERIWDTANPEQPAYIIPPVAHLTSGPSGLTYHPGTGFLESESGRFLICDYKGSGANSGIWSFQVEPSGAGMKLTDARKLNWGACATDVEYSWDGKLTVTDFIGGWASHDGGRVYSLAADSMWRAAEASQVAQWIKDGFSHRNPSELAKMLTHPDMRIRLRAQLALTRLPDGLKMLDLAAHQPANPLTRLHGVWGLGVIARRGAATLGGSHPDVTPTASTRDHARKLLVSLLADPDTEVRAQAIRSLGDSMLGDPEIPFEKLLADPSPRVRLFSAISAGKLKSNRSIPSILELLVENPNDPHLRHAGSYALSLLADPSTLAALHTHPDSKVRLAAVVALRRLKSAELVIFLNDSDPAVAAEAIRSINDQDIASIRPQVAALLDQTPAVTRTPMIWRRLLHCAFRSGEEPQARRVLKTALNPQVPAEARTEAFRLLAEWSKPHPVDQSTGRMAPLPARNPDLIRNVLSGHIEALISCEGNFLEPALSLVLKYHLDLASVTDAALQALVLNEKVPGAARAEALELYAARKPAGIDTLLLTLSTGSDDDLAIGALRKLIANSPSAAIEGLAKSATTGSFRRRQEAWKLAADIQSPGATALFTSQLTALQNNHGISPAALELLEAAEKRSEPEVKAALAAFKSSQTSATDPLAAWLPSLEGGNPEKGGQIFESHPAGQCMRCHAGGHGGGDAGPNLSDIATRTDARHLLESMVIPGAKVAMGYGIASVTLKGGKSVSGIVIDDQPKHVDLDSSGKVLRVMRSDIETMSPPVSSMPPMGYLLAPNELRDLVAWLSTQKAKAPKAKARPTPELVKP
jgi:quinoprotein glucose dehydrogenase